MSTLILETERLILRVLKQEDILEIVRFYSENREHFTSWWPRQVEGFFTEQYWMKRLLWEEKEFNEGRSVHLHLFHKDNPKHYNIASGRVLKRLGFVVEGYARDYLRINGVWEDHILTSFTNSNWRE